MSLQFVFGNSGSGKSDWLYKNIIEMSVAEPERNYLFIVPDQFTLQTQRDLVQRTPGNGILNIEVLSFRRLAYRVFGEVGADNRIILTETGKNLMLRRVMEQEKGRLKVLGSRINRIGYVSEVKSILSELIQYEVTDEDLKEQIDLVKDRPLLHDKLEDIRVLYRAFLHYQEDRFMKPEELMDVLAGVAEESGFLKNSVLAIDGFAGFTPSQLNVLSELIAVCPKVYLTVTIDSRERFFGKVNDQSLFAPSLRLIRDVTERAEGHLEEPVVLGREDLPRFSGDGALRHLEQNLFRIRQKPYRGSTEELSVHVLSSPMQEVHFVARTISKLVRDRSIRYRDIAVIAGDLDAYDNYVRRIFPMYGIPVFIDETRGVLLNPCLEFVRGAIALVLQDYDRESVFRLLRTGMLPLSSEEIDRLENHVLATGIRGEKSWEKKWEWHPASETDEELADLNRSRETFCKTVGPFTKVMKEKGQPLKAYALALYELLAGCKVQQQLKDRENELKTAGESETAAEYSQIYAITINLLDEMVELLGGEKMDCREFGQILDAGLSEARIGMVPPGTDEVQVGDIRRSRLSNIRILFFVGLNDGWVPPKGSEGGILSDTEREILIENGAELAPSERENSYIQRFYLYQNLTKPQDGLYLSYSLSDSQGEPMHPSYLVSDIRRLFPDLEVVKEPEAGSELSCVTSKKTGMLYLLNGLQKLREPGDTSGTESAPDASFMELYRQYSQDRDYAERVKALTEAALIDLVKDESPGISPKTARVLYCPDLSPGQEAAMTASITRLEQFAGCPFSHFASYGLRLTEREEYGVKAADMGTLFHAAMELFSREMIADHADWGKCSYEELSRRIDRCTDEAARTYNGGMLYEDARSAYTVKRLKKILRRSVWVTGQQLRAGSFRLSGSEISFADAKDLKALDVNLTGGARIRLQGRIDRIDTAETADTVYVKVVDYKSGNTKLDFVPMYYGRQIQLVVYMNAALEMEQKLHPGKRVVPAGVLYEHLEDPVLDVADTDEKARENLLREMRPNGLINGEPSILRLYDENMAGDSLVIPAGLKKDGTPKSSPYLVSTAEFNAIRGHVTGEVSGMGEKILGGEIAASPFTEKKRSACDYCPYADVCGFDRKIPGRCAGRSPKMSSSEIRAVFSEQGKGGGGTCR